jgi:hypothetical protein
MALSISRNPSPVDSGVLIPLSSLSEIIYSVAGSERKGKGKSMRARFSLGTVMIRPGAASALAEAGMTAETLLKRHIVGDWGDLRAQDRKQNAASLRDGGAMLSAYTLATGARILVVTTADRSTTVALAASEYADVRRAASWEGAVLTVRGR